MRFLIAIPVLLAAALPFSAQEPKATEKKPEDVAVDKALGFLASTQDKADGSWKSNNTKNAAVTSLAVMAFLSAGHVPGEGKYGEVVEKGVRYVLTQQQANGLIAGDGGHEMYHHGICTLMLAEVVGMAPESKLADEIRKKLEKAVPVILKAQRAGGGSDRGGWRYSVAHVNGSDISVTGWQVMALRAAKNVGCDVPAKNIDDAVDYIKRCQDKGGAGFRYTPQDSVTVPCTGTSILALELCGKDKHHSPEALKAGFYLIKNENLPQWNRDYFYYGVYYGSQATFQLGENYWKVYREAMHKALLRNQKDNGSWMGGGNDSYYGPNYCTAMAVLALTVEYRFLPIYQREEPLEKK